MGLSQLMPLPMEAGSLGLSSRAKVPCMQYTRGQNQPTSTHGSKKLPAEMLLQSGCSKPLNHRLLHRYPTLDLLTSLVRAASRGTGFVGACTILVECSSTVNHPSLALQDSSITQEHLGL
jgi:hypothetical protein